MAEYNYHELTPADSARIRCTGKYAECGKPAVVCQRVHWDTGNTKGLSFFYFCAEHDPRKATTNA
jgi:hypothetical protein